MSEADLENPGLKRLLRPPKARNDQTGPAEAATWLSTLPRISESQFEFVAGLAAYDTSETDLETLLVNWDANELILLLEGDMHARGIACLDAQLIAGLTEAQTTGRITNADVTERATTGLDATLCDHVVTAWMQAVAREMGKPQPDWTLGRQVSDARTAKVLLSDGDYVVTRITIVLGDAARTGALKLIVPRTYVMPKGRSGSASGKSRREVLMDVEAQLEAVLYKTKVPYTWLRDLKVDAMLEVPRSAMYQVQVRADGRIVAAGQLGRSGEKRAVRITEQDEPIPASGGTLDGAIGALDMGAAGLDMPGSGTVDDLPPLGGEDALPPLDGGGLPPLGGDGELPTLGGEADLPDLPPLGDGELPELG